MSLTAAGLVDMVNLSLIELSGICCAVRRLAEGMTMAQATSSAVLPIEIDGPEMTASPRNRLMLAVLEEALVTFQRGLTSARAEQRRMFHEVERWVASDDMDWPFSFENICGSLRIDPDYIRKGLRRLKIEALRGNEHRKACALRRERIYDRRSWRGQIK